MFDKDDTKTLRQSFISFRRVQYIMAGQSSCGQEDTAGISHIWEDQGAEREEGVLPFSFYSG